MSGTIKILLGTVLGLSQLIFLPWLEDFGLLGYLPFTLGIILIIWGMISASRSPMPAYSGSM